MKLNELMKIGNKNNINQIQMIAAVLVLFSHAFPLGYANNYGEIIKELTQSRWSFGSLAVSIFFIFSGFLVTQSYLHDNKPISFLKKRFLRIYPGLILAFVISVFIIGPLCTTLSYAEYFSSAETWTYFLNIKLIPMQWHLPGVFNSNAYGNSINGSLWTIPYQVSLYLFTACLGITGLLKRKRFVLGIFLILFSLNTLKFDITILGSQYFFGMPVSEWLYLGLYYSAGMLACVYSDQIPMNKHLARLQ